MKKLFTLAALIVAAALPTAASAQFFVGARLGYAMPFGDAAKDAPMKDGVKSEIPLQLDLGLKLGKALAAGVYGSYAIVQPKDSCPSGVTCTNSELRVGAQANLHAANTPTTEFWGGVSVGWVKATEKAESGGTTAEVWTTGYEGAIQGGLDFLASPSFRVGPFASLSVGQYTKGGFDFGGGFKGDGDITDKAMHGWFTIGLRGMFGG